MEWVTLSWETLCSTGEPKPWFRSITMAYSIGVSMVFRVSSKVGWFRGLGISRDVVVGETLSNFYGRLEEKISTILEIEGSGSSTSRFYM